MLGQALRRMSLAVSYEDMRGEGSRLSAPNCLEEATVLALDSNIIFHGRGSLMMSGVRGLCCAGADDFQGIESLLSKKPSLLSFCIKATRLGRGGPQAPDFPMISRKPDCAILFLLLRLIPT